MASHLKNHPSITLYRGFKGSGAYVWSPFVNKLEARFRFAELPYRVDCGSPLQGPRGKIPYIGISPPESQAPPRFLGDSTLIIAKLVEEGVLEDVNAKLSPAERATDLALRALLEDKLYFYQNYERWHENYYTMRPHVLHALPYPAQIVVGLLAYRKIAATLYNQGTMRFTGEEIGALRLEIWECVNALLEASKKKREKTSGASDATFWVCGGDGPSEADATLFGFVSAALTCTAGPDSKKAVKSFPTIVDYARRIHDRFYPDFTLWE